MGLALFYPFALVEKDVADFVICEGAGIKGDFVNAAVKEVVVAPFAHVDHPGSLEGIVSAGFGGIQVAVDKNSLFFLLFVVPPDEVVPDVGFQFFCAGCVVAIEAHIGFAVPYNQVQPLVAAVLVSTQDSVIVVCAKAVPPDPGHGGKAAVF